MVYVSEDELEEWLEKYFHELKSMGHEAINIDTVFKDVEKNFLEEYHAPLEFGTLMNALSPLRAQHFISFDNLELINGGIILIAM